MYKKIISIILILITISSNIFSTSANSTISATTLPDGSKPIIVSPTQYEEIKPFTDLTIRWLKPVSGTVSRYIVRARELKIRNTATEELILNAQNVPSLTTALILDGNKIKQRGYYRISICAVMADGTYHYSDERYFFSGVSKGVKPGKIISFKIWTGFEDASKGAMYYATRTWIDSLGEELVNTYAFDSGVTSSAFITGDGVNTIIPYYDSNTEYLMRATTTYTNDGYTNEVDIRINKNHPWSNNLTPGTYDVENVITHEVGHAHGIVDKYDSFSSNWTMYFKSDYLETKKRDLHSYDIQAAKDLNDLS